MRLIQKILVCVVLLVSFCLCEMCRTTYACVSVRAAVSPGVSSQRKLRWSMKFIANKLFKKYLIAQTYRRGLRRKNSLSEKIKRYRIFFKPYTCYRKKEESQEKNAYQVVPGLREKSKR